MSVFFHSPRFRGSGLSEQKAVDGLSAQMKKLNLGPLGPFIDPDCNMQDFDSNDFFKQRRAYKYSPETVATQITTTIIKLTAVVNKSWGFDFYSEEWMMTHLTALVKIFDKACKDLGRDETQKLQRDIIGIYKLGILLLVGVQNCDFSVLSDFVEQITRIDLKRGQQLADSMVKIAEDILYEQRTQKMESNGWTHDTNISMQEVLEAALIVPPKITKFSHYKKNPLLEPALWKIIFQDQRTFRVFMRATNSLQQLKERLSSFLNAMGTMREDNEAFGALVRYHYDFMKSDIIPNLKLLRLDPKIESRIQVAWETLQSALQETRPLPDWMNQDASTKALFANLYHPTNRRLYPDSDPEKLADVPDAKANWAACVLNELKEGDEVAIEKYKALLRDPQCTRYGLKAYLTKKITYNQFVSLCLAMGAINAYDPEVKMVKVVRCNEPSIRPYYHTRIELTKENPDDEEQVALNQIIDNAVTLTEQAQETSEHFVLFLEFVPNNESYIPIEKRIHSPLMNIINASSYFLFPNKNHWIIPSFTLLDSILKTVYGPEYAKPLVGLGDFPIEAFENALITGDRPFQINMWGVGNTIRADNFVTASYQLLSDPNRPVNDPTLWLHDLFHLNVVGAIPLKHRQLFRKLALFMQQKEKAAASKREAGIYRNAYERIIDMQFLKYRDKEQKNDYSEAFQLSIKDIVAQEPLLSKAVDEFKE